MKKETKEKVFYWIVGIILCSILSFIFSGFYIILRLSLGIILEDLTAQQVLDVLRKIWSETSLWKWLLVSQIIFLALIFTEVASKFNDFILKKSKWYQWIWYS